MHDLDTVIELIDAAAEWLRDKNTDQWAKPWPNRAARDMRVRMGIEARQTWLAIDADGTVAATISAGHEGNPKLWDAMELAEPAVYVQRLVVARRYAGMGVGAQLIDWAGRRGREKHGAAWIRIDVWTTNIALHHYYEANGFSFLRFCDEPDYPAGALLQKSTHDIAEPAEPLFHEPGDSRLPVLAGSAGRCDLAAAYVGTAGVGTAGVAAARVGAGARLRDATRPLFACRPTGSLRWVLPAGCAQFAGAVVTFLGFGWSFAVNAGTCLVLTAAIMTIRPRIAREPRRPPPLRAGLRWAAGNRRVRLLLVMVASIAAATNAAIALGPALADRIAGSAVLAGCFVVALSAGMLAALLMPVRTVSLRGTARLIGVLGIVAVIFSTVSHIWLGVLAAFLAGGTALMAVAATNTLLLKEMGQQHTGQLMALWVIAIAGGRPLMSVLDGWLAGLWGFWAAGLVLGLIPALAVGVLAAPLVARWGRSYLLVSSSSS